MRRELVPGYTRNVAGLRILRRVLKSLEAPLQGRRPGRGRAVLIVKVRMSEIEAELVRQELLAAAIPSRSWESCPPGDSRAGWGVTGVTGSIGPRTLWTRLRKGFRILRECEYREEARKR